MSRAVWAPTPPALGPVMRTAVSQYRQGHEGAWFDEQVFPATWSAKDLTTSSPLVSNPKFEDDILAGATQ